MPGGWLVVLALLLVLWQPLSVAAAAAASFNAVAVRGLPVVLVLILRGAVAGFGLAAGLALLRRRPAGIVMARAALVASAAVDTFVYLTPYAPNNLPPDETTWLFAASLAYDAAWLAYLYRSKRVRAWL